MTYNEIISLNPKIFDNNFIFEKEKLSECLPFVDIDQHKDEIIFNMLFSGDSLSGKKINSTFYNCCFKEIDFSFTFFWFANFQDCIFENCTLERCVFRKAQIRGTSFNNCRCRFYLNISESHLVETIFVNCFFEGIEISGTETYSLEFSETILSNGKFQANFPYRDTLALLPKNLLTAEDQILLKLKQSFDDVVYKNCKIEFMSFINMNFIDTKFQTCSLSRCLFSQCTIFKYNFDKTNNKLGWGTNNIDLISLINSPDLPGVLLKNIFNIESDLPNKLRELLIERRLSSVFISYSIKDHQIAVEINKYLKSKNVSTFFWGQDAEGGKTLNSLMRLNIEIKDRVLFIASDNSLKSPACHFELTEARKMQEKRWKTVLFPIHIDNYLFEIEYEQIKPNTKKDEYWNNIQELKEINSLDFSEFRNGVPNNRNRFNLLMSKLVNSLKIE